MRYFFKYGIILLLLVLLLVLACASSNNEIKPSHEGKLIFEDNFDTAAAGAKALFGDKYMTFEYSGGFGKLTSRSAKSVLPAMYTAPLVSDFILVFDFHTESVVPDSGYGVIFRSDDTENGLSWYYQLLIRPSNNSADLDCWKNSWVKKNHFELPQGLAKIDGVNKVRLEAAGGNFRVFVNNKFVAALTDTTLTDPGIIGLSIVSGTDKPDTVYFDNLRLYSLTK